MSGIDRLGSLVGLAPGYWDVEGIWRATDEADRAALLAGLGWAVDDPAALQAAIERLETEAWRTTLPPVLVAVEGAAIAVPVVLAPGQAAEWRLITEDGAVRTGRVEPGPADAMLTLGATDLERRMLSLEALAPGYHTLSLTELGVSTRLIVAPAQCHLPPSLAGGGRVWGLAVQLYSVRSARNWGVGDFGDLARLAELAGRAGADLIGVNPLHARSSVRPEDCSPYAPVSRLALDVLAIDVEGVPEFAQSEAARTMVAVPSFQATLAALRAAPLVDYPGVAAVKLPVLRLLHTDFLAQPSGPRRDAYAAFVAEGGETLRHYAEFEALRAWHDARIGRRGWWDWPAEPRRDDPVLAGEIDFQLWLQFVADVQLDYAAIAARRAGMRIGLYRDLAVGAAGDSAEAWAMPALAARISVGAPPDAMSRQGQDWGLPAPDPRRLAESGYAPYAALLRANMRHAGALRIDHAMSLARLFVIPPGRSGAAGTYLAYPFAALSGILALESSAQHCLVVGEDLGTVPEDFRPAMAAKRVLSYKVLAFERYPDGAFRSPSDYAPLALATAATHDLPPLVGNWLGRDIVLREAIGLIDDRAAAEADRAVERRRLLTLLDWQRVMPVPPPDPAQPATSTAGVTGALHRLIARSGSAIAMVQLDDILGEADPVNIPGTSTEYPNWRRKLSLDLDAPLFRQFFADAAGIFSAERPRA